MTGRHATHAALVVAACLGLAVAAVREARRSAEVGDGPAQAGGRTERCRACHDAAHESPGGAHAADALGCEPCHLGNPLAFDKDRAHDGLEREPGALDTVGRTCGRDGCHPREAGRVLTSLMATGRGLIAVDRWAFGELPGPDGTQTFQELLAARDPTPAEDHLRRLCAGCHLRTRGSNRDDAVRGIGSGCGACHSTRKAPLAIRAHPPVDARVPDDRCLGCHGRSARISLAYAGLAEVKPGIDGPAATRLFDDRPGVRMTDDVHHAKGLACIDCHVHPDAMGDGRAPAHEEQAVTVTCEACHPPADGATEAAWASTDDPISRDLLRMRVQRRGTLEPVRTGKGGVPIWNLRPAAVVPAAERPAAGPDGSTAPWVLAGKLDGRPHPVRPTPADANHRLRGHERLSCQACHSAWIPWCADCHTSFAPAGRQWDFGTGNTAPGAWVESSKRFDAFAPSLAVRDDRIVPAAPGMTMTLDLGGRGGTTIERRLWASWDPHTTRKESRTCASCHGPQGVVRTGPGTRATLREMDPLEQWRTLRVGPCAACHAKATDPIYLGFDDAVRRLARGGTACALRDVPAWVIERPR